MTNWYVTIVYSKDRYDVPHHMREILGPFKTLDEARKAAIGYFDLYMLKEGTADIGLRSPDNHYGRITVKIKRRNFTPFIYEHGNDKWVVKMDGTLGQKIEG